MHGILMWIAGVEETWFVEVILMPPIGNVIKTAPISICRNQFAKGTFRSLLDDDRDNIIRMKKLLSTYRRRYKSHN